MPLPNHRSHGDPADLFKLLPLGHLGLAKLARLGSLSPPPPTPFPHPYIYWQVDGWISTETPSCYRCFCCNYQSNDISLLRDLKTGKFLLTISGLSLVKFMLVQKRCGIQFRDVYQLKFFFSSLGLTFRFIWFYELTSIPFIGYKGKFASMFKSMLNLSTILNINIKGTKVLFSVVVANDVNATCNEPISWDPGACVTPLRTTVFLISLYFVIILVRLSLQEVQRLIYERWT